ncbi:unnamed protein product [Paramecium sonneborni]|uniref:Uncharacterized protein n=1 Tax=Paramecium sonneborni TaxID=65129 RepID=A0A8S1MNV3_9CILI|nr:unnamed protein product [Paramecium sonneborni]
MNQIDKEIQDNQEKETKLQQKLTILVKSQLAQEQINQQKILRMLQLVKESINILQQFKLKSKSYQKLKRILNNKIIKKIDQQISNNYV